MGGALGDPVGHLLFHHPVAQPRHEVSVVAVQLHDLLGLLVRRGDQAQRLLDPRLVQAQRVAAGDLAHQQGNQHPLAGGILGALPGVGRRNELRLDQSRVEETLGLIASTYEEPEQVVELYRNDNRLMSGLRTRVMEEQVTDWIAERATHTDETLSFQEAIR